MEIAALTVSVVAILFTFGTYVINARKWTAEQKRDAKPTITVEWYGEYRGTGAVIRVSSDRPVDRLQLALDQNLQTREEAGWECLHYNGSHEVRQEDRSVVIEPMAPGHRYIVWVRRHHVNTKPPKVRFVLTGTATIRDFSWPVAERTEAQPVDWSAPMNPYLPKETY